MQINDGAHVWKWKPHGPVFVSGYSAAVKYGGGGGGAGGWFFVWVFLCGLFFGRFFWFCGWMMGFLFGLVLLFKAEQELAKLHLGSNRRKKSHLTYVKGSYIFGSEGQ